MIRLKNIDKTYDGLIVLKDFSIDFREGKITALLGPSGCGKTTLLNIVSGLEGYESGTIEGLDDKTFSYIFQEDRLLPWATVGGNLRFVLETGYDEDAIENILDKYLEMVGLTEYRDYFPSQLSGGMKQRVAIARAFAYPSDILLMDEAFKGLDMELKATLIESFLALWEEDRRGVIIVTHDIDEAMDIAHDIFILGGRPLEIKEKKVGKNK
ncbi:MAG TPA: ABC transporter ATP-binding protein [Clostridia bacterium]|nr:ABC transporter ATP-binding protein [Clostridia bacterium]